MSQALNSAADIHQQGWVQLISILFIMCYFIFKILIIAVLDAMIFIADLITYAATQPD